MTLSALGIFSAAGATQPSAAASYELIATAFGTGASGTITFSSIPATYKHLQLRWTAKSSGGERDVSLRFNSDTGSNYALHTLRGNGTAAASFSSLTQTSITLQEAAQNSVTANAYAGGVLDILDYTQAKNKTTRSIQGSLDPEINLQSGLWTNTGVVSTITLVLGSAQNFQTASRFSLYGIKG